MCRGRPTSWRHLRATFHDRTGGLILDGTSCPKQRPQWGGVARQYYRAQGKTANCQTAIHGRVVDRGTGVDARRKLYLPESWLMPHAAHACAHSDRCPRAAQMAARAHVLRQVRASGIAVTEALGDAECGESATLRRTLHRA
jgi:SRSO17 transposase